MVLRKDRTLGRVEEVGLLEVGLVRKLLLGIALGRRTGGGGRLLVQSECDEPVGAHQANGNTVADNHGNNATCV